MVIDISQTENENACCSEKRLLDLLQDNQQNYYELFFSLILMFLALRKRKG